MQEPISSGTHVELRGEAWVVVQTERFAGCALVTLRGTGDGNHGDTVEVLTPFDRLTRIHLPADVRCVKPRTAIGEAARAVVRAHGWSDPWTAALSRIDLLPWQLEPAIAAVRGATRILLADEVGLGKTIQAGLILTELRARRLVARTLILTPAALREQWASELGDRFGLDVHVLDHDALAAVMASVPIGVNPWETTEIAISSIDLVKRGEVRAALDTVPLDLLIVDEAHHAKPATDRGALIADLATRVPWVVLATATPHSGDEEDFLFLSRVGSFPASPEMAVFRRTAEEIGVKRARRSRFRPITPSGPEQQLLDATFAYAQQVWHQALGMSYGAIVASVTCRRSVSCATALLRTVVRRHQLLRDSAAVPQQTSLPWLENDSRDAIEGDEVLRSPGLTDRELELAWLERIIALAKVLEYRSSKFDRIERLLARTREPAIVFTEYRDTLAALEGRLAAQTAVAVLHGGMSPRERRTSIYQFASGRARVLIATDAAGEGLNLQERCRLVINVEVPWSPVRLEQRVGRVDRLGQSRRVHAQHLFYRDTFEEQVLARLRARSSKMQTHFLPACVTERDIAGMIFDGTEREHLTRGVPPPAVATVHRYCRNAIAHVSLARRAIQLVQGQMAGRQRPVCSAPSGRRRVTRAFLLLFGADVHDGQGCFIARELIAVRIELGNANALHRANVCAVVSSLANSSEVQHVVSATLARRADDARAETQTTAVALERRLEAVIAALAQRTPHVHQGSLFDRRAERAARAGEHATRKLRSYLEAKQRALSAFGDVRLSVPRLISALPLTV